MNLTLPRYNCTHFCLTYECPMSEKIELGLRSLTETTHHHSFDDGSPSAVLFGSRFTTGGIVDQATGALSRTTRENSTICRLLIMYDRADATLPRPPRDYKPVSVLIDAIAELFGDIQVHCHANFQYDESLGYASGITLPIPLILPDKRGATHIESAEFSRREGDDIEYRLLVGRSEGGDAVVHSTHFDTDVELSRNSIRGLRDKARSISARFLETGEIN